MNLSYTTARRHNTRRRGASPQETCRRGVVQRFMYLVPHACTTTATSPRAYPAPRSHATARTHTAQGRAAAAPHGQTHRQAACRAQAAGVAHACAAPAVAAGPGVGDDRGRV